MANNVIGSLIVNLGLETGRLNSDTKKAAKHFNSFDKKASRALNNIKGRVSGLMSSIGLLTGVAGTLSVAGLGVMTKASIDSADKIGKLSDRLGASTEALSQYQHVAELSGITFETLTMGWQRMTRRVSEAANGTGEAKKALEELNLSAIELNQLKPEEQFEVIANSLNGLTNQADKVRLSMKLFDSSGVSLLQTMTNGAEGIRDMRQEADALGLTLSKEDAMGAASANDAMTRLNSSTKSLGLTLARELGPTLADIANFLSNVIPGSILSVNRAFKDFQIGALSVVSEFFSTGVEQSRAFSEEINLTIGRLIDERIALDAKKQEFVSSVVSVGGASPQQKEFKSEENFAKKRINLEKQVSKEITNMRWQTANLAVGFLRSLGKDHKDFARAMIIVEKGLNIARAVQNTAVAVTKAFTIDPTGVLAARVAAIGNIQIGLIAATGLGQLSQVNAGGGGISSGSTGTESSFDDVNETLSTTAQEQSSQITIYVEGSIIGNDEVRRVIVESIEQAEANDEIRILGGD